MTRIRSLMLATLAVVTIVSVEARPAAQTPQPPPAQPPDPQAQPPKPTFKSGINFVRVDVIVSDKQGATIADLKPTDFEVLEDNKPQSIESFKLIQVDGTPGPTGEPPRPIKTQYDEESEAAREDVRLFAIFLDDYHVRRGTSMSVRDPLIRFVQSLGPNDLVALMYPLTPVGDVRMTRDHDAVARAINNFWGRKWDYTPKNSVEEKYAMYPTETVERIRNQVSLSAIEGLVVHLGGLREGRKAVILVSEGYSNYVPPQLRDANASMPGLGNPNRGNPLAGEGSTAEDRAAFFSNTDLLSDMNELFNAANRSNTAIYSLDPRGLSTGEYDIDQNIGSQLSQQALNQTQDVLRVIADQTDGRAIVNRNDLAKGLQQVVRDSSAYYLIGYNSAQAPSDGKFHEIKVRVKRPGVQVRARKGYWALTAEETARALAPPKPGPPPAVERALASIAEPVRGRHVRTWIGMSRGDNGKTKVTFVWEPMPQTPGASRDLAARVSVVAGAPDGSAYFRGRVPDVAVAANGAAAAVSSGGSATASRSPSRVTFEAQPGAMQLRLSIEGANAQVLDTDQRDIQVPDLTTPQVTMSTPQVFRASTAREFQAINTDPDTVPSASREFRRTDRLVIRFEAYAPGTSKPTVSAALLNRAGQKMADVPVTAPAAGGSQIDLPLAGLAPGDYLLEIKAKDASGEASEIVPLKVTS
jgi:VWFA-related protein